MRRRADQRFSVKTATASANRAACSRSPSAAAADRLDDLVHRPTCAFGQARAFVRALRAARDQRADLARGVGAAGGQRSHFSRDDREAAARRARPCRFHGRVECKDVGLERDGLHDPDDLGHLASRSRNACHGGFDSVHGFASASRGGTGLRGERVGRARAVGVLAHRGRDLHGRRGC